MRRLVKVTILDTSTPSATHFAVVVPLPGGTEAQAEQTKKRVEQVFEMEKVLRSALSNMQGRISSYSNSEVIRQIKFVLQQLDN